MLFPDLKNLIKLKAVANADNWFRDRANNQSAGDYASLFHGLGVEFETVRPYVIGDDVRHIDWRVTARIGKPQVKTFRAECDRNILVIVDANAYMRFGTRGTFKSMQAAKVAALLCWKALQQQDKVGGLIFGDVTRGMQYFKPEKTQNNILRMLKALCNTAVDVHAEVAVSRALAHVAQFIAPQTLVFVIADFSNDETSEIEKSLAKLRKSCTVILLPTYDPVDQNIPACGQIEFVQGVQKIIVNTDDRRAREYYHELWTTYRDSLARLSKKFKIPLIWIETADDPVKALFSFRRPVQQWRI